MADTFAGLLGASELEMDSEEAVESTQISDVAINPMVAASAPIVQPVAFNLIIDLASSKSADAVLKNEPITDGTQAVTPNISASDIGPAMAEPQAAEAADAMAVPVASTIETPNVDRAVTTAPVAGTAADLPASITRDIPPSAQVAKPSIQMRETPAPVASDEASTSLAAFGDLPAEAANGPMPDIERVLEHVAQRASTPPQAAVQQTASMAAPVARKYAADGRLASEDTADIPSVDATFPEGATADVGTTSAEAFAKSSAAESKPAPTFEAFIATAATPPEGEAVDATMPQLDQSQSAQSQPTDTKTSQLSHATIRTTAELAAAMIHRLGNRSTRFDMVLTPETLGNVEVSIEVGADGQMSARMAFDNPQATAEMRARAEELRRQLIDAGFDVAENALEFTDRENDPRGGFNQFMSDSRSGRRAFMGASRLADLVDVPATPVWTPLNLARTGVDMKV